MHKPQLFRQFPRSFIALVTRPHGTFILLKTVFYHLLCGNFRKPETAVFAVSFNSYINFLSADRRGKRSRRRGISLDDTVALSLFKEAFRAVP